jgi:hypothetical protein
MKEQQDNEAWNKAARNDARFVFEHQIQSLDELSMYECHYVFRKDDGGEYKDKITQLRWESWKRAWETAKLVDYLKPLKAKSVDEILHRLEVSISEITLAKNTLESVSKKLSYDQSKLLLAVSDAFDYSSVSLCSAIKDVADVASKQEVVQSC